MAITRCLLHRQSLSLALFLLLLVLFLSVSTAKKQEESVKDDVDLTDSALIEWIRASGGHSDVRVGVVAGAPDGAEPTLTKKETKSTKKKRRRRKRSKKESSSSALRGTIATRDIAAGEAFIRLPSNLSVPLGGTGVTSPENVVLLFARRAADPAWFRELAPYWDSLPASVFTKEMYEPEHLELLQDEELAKLARNEVSWIQRVYSGETMEGRTPSLQEACAAAVKNTPTLDEFRHLTAVVASYAFHLPDDEGSDRTVMLPLLDLVNHANAGVANAIVAREGEKFTARALRDIREGEEVTHMYSHGNARNDHSVLHYGFLDRSRWERPRLCCSDLDNADLWNCSAVNRKLEDLGPAEREALRERYEEKLNHFATTVADDASILFSMSADTLQTSWKRRLLVEFRLLRKRALQQAIDELRAAPDSLRDEL